jgi:D-alanyl-D-alanine carboxypeptidase
MPSRLLGLRTSLLFGACLCGPLAFGGLDGITAESAIVIEASTGKVLFEKDADAKRYPASTTKIMTALLFLENVKPGEMITAPFDVEEVTGSSLHLKPYEQVPAEDVLYALLLRSANDAAYSVALHIGGSERRFAQMMTERAAAMGCTSTNFTNPHGLHDPQHYTTARDLAIIGR